MLLGLLSMIAGAPDDTRASRDLLDPVGTSQQTVDHLSVVADAGLITKVKAGRWVMCTIATQRRSVLRAVLGTAGLVAA